jgi:hypothetical protein
MIDGFMRAVTLGYQPQDEPPDPCLDLERTDDFFDGDSDEEGGFGMFD